MKLNLYLNYHATGAPKRSVKTQAFYACLLLLFALYPSFQSLHAQAELVCDGSTQTVAASGTFEDLIMPVDPTVAQIELIAYGADGGFADLGNGCFSEGGAGARVTARFNLGDAEGSIPYGSTVRFVVGIAGEKGTGSTVLGTGFTYGGGGGGTGILYRAPGSEEWEILVVAGGGGGAYQGSVIGICVDSKTGEGGRAGTSGGDGNGANGGPGGMDGGGGEAGGLNGFEVTGGGGGAFGKGDGLTCINLDGSYEVAEGQLGFPEGGAGGGNEGCVGSTFRDGGFGFGGGASSQAGGGGGGGYSGGGGGGNAGRGGGGGSYVWENAQNPLIEEGGLTSLTEDGFAQYRCIKRTEPTDDGPVAACVDSTVTVSLNAEGLAGVVPVTISSDTLNPDFTYTVSTAEFSCDSLGERTVQLLVMNDSGSADSCTTTVVVIDDQAPVLDCPISVEVSCEEDYSVSALGIATVTDNCGSTVPEMTEMSVPGDCANAQTITRTWTATDDSGNTNICEQVIVVSDNAAPTCENCPANMTVSCEAVPELPELNLTDNCDEAPTATVEIASDRTEDGSCGEFSYTETRTWTISDACGNTAQHTQTITVEDITSPELSCPPAVMVTCDNDPSLAGLPEVLDNCDPNPAISYDDEVISGNCDWDCMIERTWTVVDACGNASSCVQNIQQSVLELVENALAEDLDGDALADPLVIGRLNRHSLTVTLEGADCLLGWMPNNGGKAWPLIRTDFLVDGSNCSPEGLPVGADGKMNNPLIAETLLLGVKLRLDPGVGAVALSDLDCAINPIVFQGLPNNPTVADLFAQANLVVGNIIGLPFVDQYASALNCINGTYTLCEESGSNASGLAGINQNLEIESIPTTAAQLRVYPNPVRAQLWLDLSDFDGQIGQLRLLNAVGQAVMDRQLREITSEPMMVPVRDLSSGLYLLQVRVGDQLLTRQVVVQGQ